MPLDVAAVRSHFPALKAGAAHFDGPGGSQTPDVVADAVRTTLAELAASLAEPIAAVGITDQRETVVAWDRRTGQPLHRAIVWQDRRTAPRCDELRAAGHEPAIVMGRDGRSLELMPTGPALGLFPGATFRTGEGTLGAGAALVAFTDGLVEARSPGGEAFGSERLLAALRAHNSSAATLVRGVIAALQGFTGQAEPHDDVTLLVARSVG